MDSKKKKEQSQWQKEKEPKCLEGNRLTGLFHGSVSLKMQDVGFLSGKHLKENHQNYHQNVEK